MIRKIILFVFISALSVPVLFAQSDTANKEQEIRVINRVLDSWHERASVADTTYFQLFAPNAMYLGSDPKEIWTVKKFKELYMSYFLRGNAWNFKMKSRRVYLGDFGHYAWFDETLDTWMGLCRGTGVMEKVASGKWRIKHYSLTVLVPNDKIKEYVNMLNLAE
ncbi:MAG: nuclear transport factor 2 family protein [Bacteroidales bacterium]|nr:nuclear transport factor 2 family protein [Bacteroidales bacterium]